jgi:hypothetical protein
MPGSGEHVNEKPAASAIVTVSASSSACSTVVTS